jgi:hypothetical protein
MSLQACISVLVYEYEYKYYVHLNINKTTNMPIIVHNPLLRNIKATDVYSEKTEVVSSYSESSQD